MKKKLNKKRQFHRDKKAFDEYGSGVLELEEL